jgi:hypothetical protein
MIKMIEAFKGRAIILIAGPRGGRHYENGLALRLAAALIAAAASSSANGDMLELKPYISSANASAYPHTDVGPNSASAAGIYYYPPDNSKTISSQASATVRGGTLKAIGLASVLADQTASTTESIGPAPCQASAALDYATDVMLKPGSGLTGDLRALGDAIFGGVIPIPVHVAGNVRCHGPYASGGGELELFKLNSSLPNPFLLASATDHIGVGYPEVVPFDFLTYLFVSSDGLEVRMNASVMANAEALYPDVGRVQSSSGSVEVDPTFEFDQAAFDATVAAAGLPTIPLDQYFQFEFSPGLDKLGVPEPSSLALAALAGLAACASAARAFKGMGMKKGMPR